MPAPIVEGLMTYINSELGVAVWDGEVMRQAPADGGNVVSDATATSATWPVVRVRMTDQGLATEWSTEDSYSDVGPICIDVYGATRKQVQDVIDQVEALLANATNWPNIAMSDSLGNSAYFVYDLRRTWWTCVQDEGVRTKFSNLSYRGEMVYGVGVHGEVKTR